VGLWTDLASKLHERRWGVGCPNRQELQHARSALLIASALSLALMVVFSELP
jgi:hypothetical protein